MKTISSPQISRLRRIALDTKINKQILVLAIEAHSGQFRKYSNNIPYIVHPIEVAYEVLKFGILSHFRYDTNLMFEAALLHDSVEDGGPIYEQRILDIAGQYVHKLVLELTNCSKKHPELNREQRKSLDREHLSQVSDEAKIIKLIDRTSNLRDMINAPSGFKRLYLKESELLLEVLTPSKGDFYDETIGLRGDFKAAMRRLEESL